jgi:hypothetical protein
MAVRTEVIKAPNNIDMMLRAWFCKRDVSVVTNGNAPMNVHSDPFKFDIFLPPHMFTKRVSAIANFIKLESTCRSLF